MSSRIGTIIIVQAQTLKCFLLKWDNEQLVPSGFDGTKVVLIVTVPPIIEQGIISWAVE